MASMQNLRKFVIKTSESFLSSKGHECEDCPIELLRRSSHSCGRTTADIINSLKGRNLTGDSIISMITRWYGCKDFGLEDSCIILNEIILKELNRRATKI